MNKRLDSPSTLEQIRLLYSMLGGNIYIENVAYQQSVVDLLRREGLPAVGVNPGGQDKRMRLSTITYLIQSGKVIFPKHGAEQLITQLIGFGVEKHDDLVDAFTMLLHQIKLRDIRQVRAWTTKAEMFR